MTPQDHNKVIGIMHLIWGGFNTLLVLIIYPIILGIMLTIFRSDPNAPPELVSIFTAVMVAVFVLSLLLSLPPLLAGYAILKRKPWAKVMSIVAACFEALLGSPEQRDGECRVGGQNSRTGRRRERRGDLQLGVVASTRSAPGVGPRMIEDVFALAVMFHRSGHGRCQAAIGRFEPREASIAMFATAGAHAVVVVIALVAGLDPELRADALFVAAWVVSALLFRQASQGLHPSRGVTAAGDR